MGNKNWLMSMLSEGSEVSMKRVVTSSAFCLLAIAFLLNLFWDIKVNDALLNIMENIVFAGVFSTMVEKFAKKVPADVPIVDESSKA